ncbi:MAG: transglutaminase domain-containing protein [Candidatus Nanoarchaeia archaeon]|nr:transglutaminase domain-containing protein [Candidatus Nanoarchaeia archaeon]
MKYKLPLLMILLILSSTLVLAQTPNQYQTLDLTQSLTANIELTSTKSSPDIDYLETKLHYFPKPSTTQKILSESYIADKAIHTTDEVSQTFKWTNPKTTDTFQIYAFWEIQNKFNHPKITQKVNFHLENIPPELNKYTQFTNTINTNNQIKQKAQELAQGETDLFSLELQLAKFVSNHLEYSLDVYISDQNLQSTWAFENKKGACDEFTNLFISLNRELGIPTRFVAGIAYTNSELFNTEWGNHAWAEVYFPEFGWVPFDVTYSQYGFVDATHIVFSKEVDGEQKSISYSALGSGFELNPSKLIFETNIVKKTNQIQELLDISLEVKESSVGFGSYNVLIATLKNKNAFYIIEKPNLAQTTGISIIAEPQKLILLKPNEEKKIYWILKVDEDLNQNYLYTFPIHYYSSNEYEYTTTFESSKNEKIYDEQSMLIYAQNEEIKPTQKYILTCEIPQKIMQYSNQEVSCILNSKQNPTNIKLKICSENLCKDILEDTKFDLEINTAKVGTITDKLTISYSQSSEQHFLTYAIIDEINVSIENITSPEEINYNSTKNLIFEIHKHSYSSPTNATLNVNGKLFNKNILLETLNPKELFEIQIKGKDLLPGENIISINLEYVSLTGESTTLTQEVKINLNNTNILQKIISYTKFTLVKITRFFILQ